MGYWDTGIGIGMEMERGEGVSIPFFVVVDWLVGWRVVAVVNDADK